LSGLAAEPALCQDETQSAAVVLGRVLDDESSNAIDLVEVRLVGHGEDMGRVTDSEGAFIFTRVQPGYYEVVLKHLAYGTHSDSLEVGKGEVVEYEVRLRMRPIELAPLVATVERRRVSPMLLGFYERMSLGMGGHFITREDIERRQPVKITHMIADLPGVRRGWRGLSFTRHGGCSPAVFLDRMYLGDTRRTNIDWVVSPIEVEAIEVYKGAASLPAEFGGGGGCGAIVIWTRRGL
jgi:hypothetical protein